MSEVGVFEELYDRWYVVFFVEETGGVDVASRVGEEFCAWLVEECAFFEDVL